MHGLSRNDQDDASPGSPLFLCHCNDFRQTLCFIAQLSLDLVGQHTDKGNRTIRRNAVPGMVLGSDYTILNLWLILSTTIRHDVEAFVC